MDIYVFNSRLERKGILENWFSTRWVRRYSKCGEFEIHSVFKKGMPELLREDDIIWKNNSEEAGVIEHVNIKLDEQGNEIYVITGRFTTSYIGRRIVWNRIVIDETNEKIIRKIINDNVINPSNPNRKISMFELGEALEVGQKTRSQMSFENVLDATEKMAESDELGTRTRLDPENKRHIFEIYQGLDRTAGQNINPPAIFSQEFENVIEQEYTSAINDYKNTALIAGAGEGAARKFESIEVGTGLNRHELYVDARDLQDTRTVNEQEVPIPPNEYKEMLLTRASEKLAENKRIESFDSKVDLNANLIYKKDFDLGDKVTIVSNRWNVIVDKRITEIEEVYESDGLTVFVTFGEEEKGIVQKIKREVSR